MIKRIKEWLEYSQAVKDMKTIKKLQDKVPFNEDGTISEDNKKIWLLYEGDYRKALITVLAYEAKHGI